MLAGAATLEFVRAAAHLARPGVRHALREVVWGRAVEVADGERTVYVSFRPDGDALLFEVYGETGGERTTHARGRAVPAPAAAPAAPEDLDALRARLPVLRDRAGAYADYTAAGFGYGPSFQVIDEIRAGPARPWCGSTPATAARSPRCPRRCSTAPCGPATGRAATPRPARANSRCPSASAHSTCTPRCRRSASRTPGGRGRRPASAAST
ncbi:polyketide synthase dehydratase domain-containing protein [Streptomyces sp. DHE7-1]|nr:polyketide synthase dehydratase domain-containing protein [Streptomyces sp. DHE7-1]